ncbi:MAG: hypothetical protein RRY54_02585 [Angelakisella sp.]
MDIIILGVIIVFFALLGFVDFCVGAARWLRKSGDMSSAMLMLEITEEEKSTEARLMQAVDATLGNSPLAGIKMAVICVGEGENATICRRFCRERGIPLMTKWTEINGIKDR